MKFAELKFENNCDMLYRALDSRHKPADKILLEDIDPLNFPVFPFLIQKGSKAKDSK